MPIGTTSTIAPGMEKAIPISGGAVRKYSSLESWLLTCLLVCGVCTREEGESQDTMIFDGSIDCFLR